MFIELLYGYVFGEKIDMACPIVKYGNIDIFSLRASYPERYEEMLKTIREDCMRNGFDKNMINLLIEVIEGMANPDPNKRYQSIDLLINNLHEIK
jgi:hypothetical protein